MWVDGRYLDVDDRRYGLSTNGYSSEASFGVDRLVGTDMTLGVAVAPERLDLEGYGRTVKLKGTGYRVGPSLGYRVAPNVIVDAWAGYSRIDTNLDIGTVTGSYKTDRWFGSATITSQHAVGLVLRQDELAPSSMMRRRAASPLRASAGIWVQRDEARRGLCRTEMGR